VATGLRIFWLWLALSEQIKRLASKSQRVYMLQNSGFNRGGITNQTSRMLLKAAITKQSEQRADPFKHVWNVQRGELSALSDNLWAPTCWNWLILSTHQLCLLQLLYAVLKSNDLVLRNKSQSLQLPAKTCLLYNPYIPWLRQRLKSRPVIN